MALSTERGRWPRERTSRRSTERPRSGRGRYRTGGAFAIGHRRLGAGDGRGMGTSRCARGPRGARAPVTTRAGCVVIGPPSPARSHRQGRCLAGRRTEPRGDGRATVAGDRTDGSGVAAQPDPARHPRRCWAPASATHGVGVAQELEDQLAGCLYAAPSPGASMPAAKAAGHRSSLPPRLGPVGRRPCARLRPDGVAQR